MKEAAAERGTAIHSCMEHYLKKNSLMYRKNVKSFGLGCHRFSDQFQEVVWAETPLLEKHKFALSEDGVGRVRGCDGEGEHGLVSPDIIGVAGNNDAC
jgi:hypothetical protein